MFRRGSNSAYNIFFIYLVATHIRRIAHKRLLLTWNQFMLCNRILKILINTEIFVLAEHSWIDGERASQISDTDLF